MDATLVVMAAGMGSRFGGLKQLEPIGKNGEVILDFSVYDAVKAGFNKLVFVIKHEIEDDFKRLVGNRIAQKVKVEYAFQEVDSLPKGYEVPDGRTKPWGTGHAVLCCASVVHEPFAVINADDYYGQSAFRQIYERLCQDRDNFCMVGFRLANTITDNGTVSRGVCKVENGFLLDVKEYTAIHADCTADTPDGTVSLSPDTVVSMNMWGFTPDIFTYLARDFKRFLDEKRTVPKAEFYLPSVVDGLIKDGTKKAGVMVAEDKWYGVTYKEDKEPVVKAVCAMMDAGLYDGI